MKQHDIIGNNPHCVSCTSHLVIAFKSIEDVSGLTPDASVLNKCYIVL